MFRLVLTVYIYIMHILYIVCKQRSPTCLSTIPNDMRVFLRVPLGPISPATGGLGVPAPTLAIGGVGGVWTMPGWWISGGPTGGPVEQCRT